MGLSAGARSGLTSAMQGAVPRCGLGQRDDQQPAARAHRHRPPGQMAELGAALNGIDRGGGLRRIRPRSRRPTRHGPTSSATPAPSSAAPRPATSPARTCSSTAAPTPASLTEHSACNASTPRADRRRRPDRNDRPASLLQRLGIPALDRRAPPGPKRAPAAHAVNARSFEICRQARRRHGGHRRACAVPRRRGGVTLGEPLGGDVLGSLPFERQDDGRARRHADAAAQPLPAPPRADPARRLARLRRAPSRASAPSGSPPPQDEDGVTSRSCDAPTDAVRVRSRWLVAADGAGSPVRKCARHRPRWGRIASRAS
jgi:hypothetical protein